MSSMSVVKNFAMPLVGFGLLLSPVGCYYVVRYAVFINSNRSRALVKCCSIVEVVVFAVVVAVVVACRERDGKRVDASLSASAGDALSLFAIRLPCRLVPSRPVASLPGVCDA